MQMECTDKKSCQELIKNAHTRRKKGERRAKDGKTTWKLLSPSPAAGSGLQLEAPVASFYFYFFR